MKQLKKIQLTEFIYDTMYKHIHDQTKVRISWLLYNRLYDQLYDSLSIKEKQLSLQLYDNLLNKK